jgi:hypothetical protein
MEKISYVTYQPDGALDGSFIQVPPDEHIGRMIVVGDAIRADWPLYRANVARDGVELLPPAPPPTPTQAEYTAVMQAALDGKAKERKYDGIMSLCTYATSTNSRFAEEGQAGVTWRDDMWAFGYDLLARVEAGTVPAPTLDELATMLPKMEWPE